jgi:hypothetical protein
MDNDVVIMMTVASSTNRKEKRATASRIVFQFLSIFGAGKKNRSVVNKRNSSEHEGRILYGCAIIISVGARFRTQSRERRRVSGSRAAKLSSRMINGARCSSARAT